MKQKREKALKKARDELDKAKSTMAAPSELFRGDATRAAAYSKCETSSDVSHRRVVMVARVRPREVGGAAGRCEQLEEGKRSGSPFLNRN